MLLTNEEVKQFTCDLRKITDELKMVDFLRDHFYYEYPDIFDKEIEEKIKIAQNKISYAYDMLSDFDINRYTLFVLKKEFLEKYDIGCEYTGLNTFKVIIFFENLLKPLTTEDKRNIEKNRKIDESKKVYNFFRGLIANEKCQISKHNEAIRILGFKNLTQEYFDEDIVLRNCIKVIILDKYLTPFISEYENFL